MSEFHTFNLEDAQKYGLKSAVLLFHLQTLIKHNVANRTNFHDGEYWTCVSLKNLQRQFTYLSTSQIRNALKKLENAGVIKTDSWNRKKWYRVVWED